MSRIQIDIPDAVAARVEQMAGDAGFDTAAEYVRAMVIADAVQSDPISENALERLLLERLDEPDEGEMNSDFFEDLRRQVRQAGGAGK